MTQVLDLSVSIVGAGRAARAFARSWIGAGGRFGEVFGRDPQKLARAISQIGAGKPRLLSSGSFACDLLILGVPDDAIREVAGSLAMSASCRAVFHLSGAIAAAELAAFLDRAVRVGSLHPARAFSGSPEENWRGAFVAVEGENEAVLLGRSVALAVGANPHSIAASAKPLYHAAATLAAGGSLALVSMAARAWVEAGISEEEARLALAELAAGAVRAGAHSFAEAFTGPVARRDVETVRAHAAALCRSPAALAVYCALARETLSRTPGRGKEAEILDVLETCAGGSQIRPAGERQKTMSSTDVTP